MNIKFRPHHFLCAVGFDGKGYSNKFVVNFAEIVKQLRGPDGDQIPIEVVGAADSICAPCPHKRETLCTSQAKIEALDKAHAEILGIKPGDKLTWGEAKQKIVQKMSLIQFEKSCAPCEWKKLGVCEQALQNLIKRK